MNDEKRDALLIEMGKQLVRVETQNENTYKFIMGMNESNTLDHAKLIDHQRRTNGLVRENADALIPLEGLPDKVSRNTKFIDSAAGAIRTVIILITAAGTISVIIYYTGKMLGWWE